MKRAKLPPFAFHLATPAGEGGIAVFELYGDGTEGLLAALFRGRRLPGPAASRLGNLVDLEGEVVDEVVVSRVPSEGMWCRMAAWTVSVHGGPWIQSRVTEILGAAGGTALSRAEVLSRALAEGTLDAIEAAAFEHLVAARTERAAAFFARQHQGELSGRLRGLLRRLGEQEVGASVVRGGARILRDLLRGAGTAFRLGHPLRLLIAGRPNSGKSTLFNALAERERVIVSRERGTTRDFIRELIALEGFPVEVIDSAGLDPAPGDPVERQAIDEVWKEEPDAVLYLAAAPWRLGPLEAEFIARFPAGRVLEVANFSDLEANDEARRFPVRVSALRGDGLDLLRQAILDRWLGPQQSESPDPAAPFTAPQRRLLERALDSWGERDEPHALDGARDALIMVLRSSWPAEPGEQ